MRLQLLELLVWVQVGVFVVESNHHTQQNLVRFHMVHKGAGVDVACNWPIYCMVNKALFVVRIALSYLPHLLEPNTVVLSTNRVLVKLKLSFEFFC